MLLALPHELTDRITFWVANIDHKLPPASLVPLLQSCRTLHSRTLGTPSNPHHTVLAHISRFRYDTAAPRRRFGPLLSCVLASELKIRCPALRRVRAQVIYGPHVVSDAWVILMMLWEDDGRNMEQLAYARVERWVKKLIRHRVHEHTDRSGWPVETELVQLAVAIYAIVGTCSLPDTPELEREHLELEGLLLPFVYAAHRYPSFHLPETFHCFSTSEICGHAHSQFQQQHTHLAPPLDTNTPPAAAFQTLATTPIHAPTRLPQPLWGRFVVLSRPLIAGSAILAGQIGWAGLESQARDQELELEGEGRSARFDTDFHRLALVHLAMGPQLHEPELYDEEQDTPGNVNTLALNHLTDNYLAECWAGPGRLWTPGMFSGVWEGVCNIPPFAWYTGMLAMHPHLPSFAFGTEDFPDSAYQPVRLTFREHVNTDLTTHMSTGPMTEGDGVRNGWFPNMDPGRTWMYESGDTLFIHDPREPDDEYALKRYRTVRPDVSVDGGVEIPPPREVPGLRSQHMGVGEDGVPLDVGTLLDVEMCTDEGGDADADEDVMDADDDEVPVRVDVIITGETDPEHAARWGACKIYGRVRRNDGLVVFIRVHENLDQGRWMFRGYIHGGNTLVGRWRETSTSIDVAGYEGSFVLRKIGAAR